MSTRLQPAKSSLRQNNIKWLNSIVHSHDFFCDCPTPLQHAVVLIFQQEPDLDFKPIEKDLLKKCLGEATTANTATAQEDYGIEEGTLEDLFKEDFGEENVAG